MELSTSSNVVTIKGNIKNLSDHQAIKEAIDALATTNKNIKIKITDSISIISSVIGYLNKLVLKDGVDISIDVGNAQLKELFDDLNLTTLFKVKKV
ncbi:hypothetical protein [Sulfurimonas sp.]|uniref:hypothetical protein n=1 Tax=Sulfurimonas sp. TaxID=2022749 RepID=UPI00261053C1|nr:hypothetical protein [Sulfurimonas sp.]